jgi:hypothetical protein
MNFSHFGGAKKASWVGPRRVTVAAATVAAAFSLTTIPAFAGDMAKENEALRNQVEDLTQEVQILKKMVLKNQEAVQEAAAGPDIPSKIVTSGKDKVSLKISGQVNRMVMYADDENEARFFHADSDASSTRIRFEGKSKMDGGWSAGANVEVQFESNSSADVTINQNAAVLDNDSFTERKLEVYFANKDLGKISIGQGDTASNGTSEQDLSGTTLASMADASVFGKELAFRVSNTRGTSSGRDIGDLFDHFDGLSRDDRLRYDSPTFGGFKIATSWVDGDENDIALFYGREFDGTEVAAAASYWEASPTNQISGISSSASVKLPFGTSFTLAYAQQDSETVGRDTESFVWGKIGHTWKPFGIGKTSISFDYGEGSDQAANNIDSNFYSLGAVQKVDDLGAELYAVWRQLEADIPNVQTDNITVAGLGARIKF